MALSKVQKREYDKGRRAQDGGESNRERAKTWYSQNKERALEKAAEYRRNNRGVFIESSRKYRSSKRYKDAMQVRRKLYKEVPAIRLEALVKGAFIRCVKAGMEFDQILKNVLMENPPTHCACCGVRLAYDLTSGKYSGAKPRTIPTLDRVDSRKGYTVLNTRVVCWWCNLKKSDMSLLELETILAYVKRNLVGQEELA